MSSPERIALMERNITRLALLVKQLGEFELANQQRRLDWIQWIEENDQRMRESDQRIEEGERRLQEGERRIQEGELRLQENERRLQEDERRIQEGERRLHENEQRMQESNQRMRERDQRMQTILAEIRRLNEQSAAQAENLRAMLDVIVDIQTDVARIDAAS